MKTHVCNYLILCLIATLVALCSCSSSKQRSTLTTDKTTISELSIEQQHSNTSFNSHTQTTSETEQNWYRYTRTYDTMQPVNPETGLPPIQSETIEGSQAMEATYQENNQSVHVSEDTETETTTDTATETEHSDEKESQGDALQGVNKGLQTGISIAIPLLMLILGVYIYAKLRKKNSRK